MMRVYPIRLLLWSGSKPVSLSVWKLRNITVMLIILSTDKTTTRVTDPSLSGNEPPRDKTNNVAVRPVWSESSLCTQWVARTQALFKWTAKTLIRLGWSESSLGAQSFCWFCHEAAQMYTVIDSKQCKPFSMCRTDENGIGICCCRIC